jgi:hypothetical protein
MTGFLVSMTIDTAVRITTVGAMAAVIIDAMEVLSSISAFSTGAVYGRDVQLLINKHFRRLHANAFGSAAVSPTAVAALTVVQIICAALAMMHPSSAPYAIALILVIRTLFNLRHSQLGSEGADHALGLTLVALLVCHLSSNPLLRHAGAWFLSAEIMLAYLTSGAVKARHPQWQNGTALRQVFGTELFGNRILLRFLSSYPTLATLSCRMVIGLECLLPLLFFAGPQWCLVFLILAAGFHFTVALSQGLNLFLPVFVSTYPLILLSSRDFWIAVSR